MPASPGALPSHVAVRSPEATRSATSAASRIGRVIVRASQSATAVTIKIVARQEQGDHLSADW